MSVDTVLPPCKVIVFLCCFGFESIAAKIDVVIVKICQKETCQILDPNLPIKKFLFDGIITEFVILTAINCVK